MNSSKEKLRSRLSHSNSLLLRHSTNSRTMFSKLYVVPNSRLLKWRCVRISKYQTKMLYVCLCVPLTPCPHLLLTVHFSLHILATYDQIENFHTMLSRENTNSFTSFNVLCILLSKRSKPKRARKRTHREREREKKLCCSSSAQWWNIWKARLQF